MFRKAKWIAGLLCLATGLSAQEIPAVKAISDKCRNIKLLENCRVLKVVHTAATDSAIAKKGGFHHSLAWLSNGSIVRICDSFAPASEGPLAVAEYFFSNDSMIFAAETDFSGTGKAGSNGDAFEPVYEARYYFHQDKLIFTHVRGKPLISPDENFFDSQNKEGQLLVTAGQLFGLCREKADR